MVSQADHDKLRSDMQEEFLKRPEQSAVDAQLAAAKAETVNVVDLMITTVRVIPS